jgi:RimJ/RimL family protein N-acetyltransferase
VIFELNKNDFIKILPLYLKEEIIFPLILAVIEQKQPGWVFVDNPTHPASMMVVTKFGFMQFAGTEGFGDSITKLFESPKTYLPSYLLWYSPPLQIQKILDRVTPEHVRRRERTRFIFKKQIIENPIECPAGFEVQWLDEELIKKTGRFKLDIGSRFWASTDDFLEHGIGACVMKDGEIASLCYSACVVNNLAEVDVVTQEEYRGMGLAVVAAQNFMSECMRRGITPTWDCFVNNTASMKLAVKLGFEKKQTYLLYSFNTPINLVSAIDELNNEID